MTKPLRTDWGEALPFPDIWKIKKDNTATFYNQGGVMKRNIVAVKFKNYDKTYSYFTDLELKVDDHVVVDSPSTGFEVVKVTEVQGMSTSLLSKASKWIVQKLDIAGYEKKKEVQRLVQEVKNKLKQRKDEMEEMLLYQQLADKDPEIMKLMKELGKLDSSYKALAPAKKRKTGK
jgi:hypothetical protein